MAKDNTPKESVIDQKDLEALGGAPEAVSQTGKKTPYMPPPRSALKPGTYKLPSGLVMRNA